MMGEIVREKPIVFSGEMVRAILGGRKTQTRRVIKPQPDPMGASVHQNGSDVDLGWWHWKNEVYGEDVGGPLLEQCSPYGKPGDLLWVKETHARYATGAACQPHYYADGPLPSHDIGLMKKYPSRFMPRWASRITLRITDLRVERVQGITEDDAIAEGATAKIVRTHKHLSRQYTAVHSFASLWNRVYAERGYGWGSNPWVWVVEFSLCTLARKGADDILDSEY